MRGTVGDVGLASADEGVGEGENVRWRGRRGMVSMFLRVCVRGGCTGKVR